MLFKITQQTQVARKNTCLGEFDDPEDNYSAHDDINDEGCSSFSPVNVINRPHSNFPLDGDDSSCTDDDESHSESENENDYMVTTAILNAATNTRNTDEITKTDSLQTNTKRSYENIIRHQKDKKKQEEKTTIEIDKS